MKPKTIKELIDEMGHRLVSNEEIEAAREYERSLIPEHLIIPQKGERYKSIREVDVTSMIQFAAPFTGGEECVLPLGTEIEIEEVFEEKPIVISCLPVKRKELESIFVPKEDRENNLYAGYHLYIQTVEFVDGFELTSCS